MIKLLVNYSHKNDRHKHFFFPIMLLFGALLHVSLLDIVNEDNDALHNYGDAGSILDTGFNVIVYCTVNIFHHDVLS